MKLNYPMILASVIAGIAVLLVSKYLFTEKLDSATGKIETKFAWEE
jgi:hypothetical protein